MLDYLDWLGSRWDNAMICAESGRSAGPRKKEHVFMKRLAKHGARWAPRLRKFRVAPFLGFQSDRTATN